MIYKLIELNDKNEICKTYEFYKHCMFIPTEEKFKKKIDTFLNDNSVKVFACLYYNEIKGVIAISFAEQYKIEIFGIAVDMCARHQGISSFMISKLADDYGLLCVYAETDDDAVGFYQKSGFNVTEFSETYDSETVIRYKCELVK